LGVFPEHTSQKALRDGAARLVDVVIVSGFKCSLIHAAGHLRESRDDAILRVLTVSRVRRVKIQGNRGGEQGPGEHHRPSAIRSGVNEKKSDRHTPYSLLSPAIFM
jgi:hypothetical protein